MCNCVPVTAEEVSKIFWDFIRLGNETDQQTHVMSGSDFIASFSSKFDLVCLPPPFVPSFSGKKNKLRVYYLSWLRNRILHNDPEVEKKQGWITVGELEGCVHYKVGK